MPVTKDVTVRNKVGLHARPAALFVKTAIRFKSLILVENLLKKSKPVNAKSLLSLLSIGVQMNDSIRISCEGEDEQTALAALTKLVDTNFGEAV